MRKKRFEVLESTKVEDSIWKEVVKDLANSRRKPFPRFKVYIQMYNVPGKKPIRPSKTDYAPNITEARHLREQLKGLLRSQIQGPSRLKVRDDFEETYYLEVEQQRGRAQTAYNELCNLKGAIVQQLGALHVDEITADVINNFLKGLPCKDPTKRNYKKHIANYLKSARRRGLINHDPMPDVDGFSKGKKGGKKNFLMPKMLAALIAYAIEIDHPWKIHWLISAYCGIRPGELRGLLVRDILWDAGLIYVVRVFTRKEGFVPHTKNYDIRHVPLPEDLRDLLRAHVEENNLGPDDLIVPQLRKWKSEEQCEPLRDMLALMGLPKITYYELRHSFAVAHLEAGTPINRLSEILGHSSVEYTAYYVGRLGTYLRGSSDCLKFASKGRELLDQVGHAGLRNYDFLKSK